MCLSEARTLPHPFCLTLFPRSLLLLRPPRRPRVHCEEGGRIVSRSACRRQSVERARRSSFLPLRPLAPAPNPSSRVPSATTRPPGPRPPLTFRASKPRTVLDQAPDLVATTTVAKRDSRKRTTLCLKRKVSHQMSVDDRRSKR